MDEVASRDLHNSIARRPRWVPRHELASIVLGHQADHGLAEDLGELAGGSTVDLPFS